MPVQGDGPATLARIKAVVTDMRGARVVTSKPDYLYAQFTTPLLQFVDDVEFWFDPAANVIHVRSASRIGRGDLGENRRRIEAIRHRAGSQPLSPLAARPALALPSRSGYRQSRYAL